MGRMGRMGRVGRVGRVGRDSETLFSSSVPAKEVTSCMPMFSSSLDWASVSVLASEPVSYARSKNTTQQHRCTSTVSHLIQLSINTSTYQSSTYFGNQFASN